MKAGVRDLVVTAAATVVDDLRSDPYLRYVLLLALATTGFWFWHRAPNFATPDEYGRLLRPMKAAGYFLADPGLASFARGATDGVAQGATFYLYGLTTMPVAAFVFATGRLGTFAGLASIESRWTLWQAVPAWYWTSTVVIARFANVLVGVACVYVTYRLGTAIHDRRAGRFAAVLLSLSLGFVASAHEIDEDTAMLLVLLVVLYLALRYARNGDGRYFLAGCGLGGLAIAFKLTAGIVVPLLATAFAIRAGRSDEPLPTALYRPRLLLLGALLGAVTIYVGIPKVLFSGPDDLLARAALGLSSKLSPKGEPLPPGYPVLYGYLSGVGLPLTLGFVAGTAASARRLWRRDGGGDARLLLFVGLAVSLAVFLQWQNLKPHHLLPTYPLFLLPVGVSLSRLSNRDGTAGRAGRIVAAALVVSTALYAGGGIYQYAVDPRDMATGWFRSEASPDETITVYENSIADVGVPHGYTVDHYDFVEEVGVHQVIANESAYTDWVLRTHRREPEYVEITGTSYLDPTSRLSARYPERSRYIREMAGGAHGYVVVREFGERPEPGPPIRRLLYAGIVPEVEKVEPYVVILRRERGG